MQRREFLRRGVVLGVACATALPLAACADTGSNGRSAPRERTTEGRASDGGRVLLVYFSRAGENYFHGGRTNLRVGNTEVVATMIQELLRCDALRIEPSDPYSDDYDATVARNVREQEADARPGIANLPRSIDPYETVLLGSPVWNVRPPMIMHTFADAFDFSGKSVFPFTTSAMSGLASAPAEYAEACRGATIGRGLAIQGEEATSAQPAVESWLRSIGLLERGARGAALRLPRSANRSVELARSRSTSTSMPQSTS